MKYILLVSHGKFSEGIRDSLSMFVEDKMDQVIAVGLKKGQSVDDFSKTLSEKLVDISLGNQIIILSDIIGGSPLTTTLNYLDEKGLLDNSVVLGGMNLTMAITATVMKEISEGDDFVDNILSESHSALQEFKISDAKAEEDEEDFI